MIREIERDGGTRYQVYGRRNGTKVYLSTHDSKREALAAEEDHRVTQRKIDRGELAPDLDLKRTLRVAVGEWLKSLEARGSRSHDSYTTSMDLYVLPELGDVAIASLNRSRVMRWRDGIATKKAPATVNGALACLSSAFSYFVDRDWLTTNPCHGVARVERPDRLYTWIQTRDEITKLLVQCPGDLRDIVALALGAGLRLDELLHLQWADVDIERRLISVHRGRQGTVKSGKERRVPILECVLPMLRQRALARAGALLVFPGRGGEVRSKPGVQAAYKLAVKRATLDLALRFHDLRHTFASHWVLDGGDIFRLSRILGHSNVTITQRTYAHLAPEAWTQDYHRVGFHVPTETPVYRFQHGPNGRLTDRVVAVAG